MSGKFRFKTLIPFLVLAAALVSGTLLVRPVEDFVRQRMEELRSMLLMNLKKEYGLVLVYEKLDYSLLFGVRVANARLEWDDGEPFASCKDLVLDYDILNLVRGDLAHSIKGLDINTARLDLDVDKRRAFLEKVGILGPADLMKTFVLSDINDLFTGFSTVLPRDVAFRIKNLELGIKSTGLALNSRLDRALMISRDRELQLELAFGFKLDLPGIMIPPTVVPKSVPSIGSTVELSASFYPVQRELRLSLGTSAIDTPWLAVKPQNFRVVLDDSSIQLVKVEDEQALDVSLDYNQDAAELAMHLKTADWQVLSLVTPKVDIPELVRNAARTVLDLGADVVWNFKTNSLAYQGTLNAAGWIPGLGDGVVSFKASGNLDHVRLEHARLASKPLNLEFSGQVNFADLGIAGHVRAASSALIPGRETGIETDIAGAWKTGYDFSGLLAWLDSYRIRSEVLHWAMPGPVMELSGTLSRLDPAGEKEGSLQLDLGVLVEEQEIGHAVIIADSWVLDSTQEPYGLALDLVENLVAPEVLAYLPHTLVLSGEIRSPSTGPVGPNFDLRDLVTRGLSIRATHPEYSADFVLDLDQRMARISAGKVRYGGIDGGLRLSANLTSEGKISSTGSFWANNLPETGFSLTWMQGDMVDLQTSNGLYINAHIGEKEVGGFVRLFRFSPASIGIQGFDGIVSASGNYRFSTLEDWQVQLELLDFGFMALNPLVPDRKVRLWAEKVTLGPRGFDTKRAHLQDTVSLMNGSVVARWDGLPPGTVDLEFDLSRNIAPASPVIPAATSPERYGAKISLRDGRIEGSLAVRSSPLSRFAAEGLNGLINGDMALSGTLDAPRLKGSFSVTQGTFNKDTLTAQGAFSYADHALSLTGVRLGLGSNLLDINSLEFAPDVCSITGNGGFRNSGWQAGESMAWAGSARWNPQSPWAAFEGNLAVRGLPTWISPSGNWQINARSAGGRIVFGEYTANSIQGTVFNDFSYEVTLGSPFPIRTSASGFFRGTSMEANLSNISIDASISRLFPFAKDFWMSEGLITGDIRIAGDTNDPGFFGSLKGENVVAHVSYLDMPVRAQTALVTCSDHTLKLLPVHARADAAKAQATMSLELSRYNVQSVQLVVETEEDTAVKLKTGFPGIKVNGMAKGRMEFRFLPTRMELAGNLVAVDTELSLGEWGKDSADAAEGATAKEVDDYGMIIGLDVTSAKGVVFYWPSRDLPLVTANIDPGQKIHIAWDKNRETYSLKGQVKSRGGSITYLKRDFILRETYLDFNESELGFDPTITFKADLRTHIDNESYRLTWFADHERLSKLFQNAPRIESVPGLSQSQIAGLLSGDTLSADNTTSWENLLSTAADATSQLALKNVLDPLRTLMGADVLMVRLGFVKGLATDFLNLLSPIDNQIDSLEKYLNGTSLLVGKYLGEDLYLEGSLQVVDSEGIFGSKDLDMSVEINMEWATPLFNLVWTFRPRNAESLFIPDNTFSFTFDLIR